MYLSRQRNWFHRTRIAEHSLFPVLWAITAYESLMELLKDGDERLPKRKDAITHTISLKKSL